MDSAGEHAFSGAAGTGHENGGTTFGDCFDEVENFSHFIILADNVSQAVFLLKLVLERDIFAHKGLLTNRAFDREPEFVIDDGLCEIIVGSLLDGLDGAFDSSLGGNNNYN
jgi:hypothetical protein